MSLTITSPTPTSVLFVGESFTMSGTASGAVSVRISADGAPNLATVPVTNGVWTFSRSFSRPGARTITAEGLDASGQVVAGATATVAIFLETDPDTCDLAQPQFRVGNSTTGIPVYRLPGHTTFFFRAGLMIDADGAPHAYHPDNIGLDHNANGHDASGHWFAVVCSDSARLHPVIQKSTDPAPGYYISTTSLENTALPRTDPHRYVDSETIPYFVLPGSGSMGQLGAKLGDYGAVYNPSNGKLVLAIYGDVGPRTKLGEGSIALAKALGVPSSPKTGGMDTRKLIFVVFPGSRTTPWTHQETAAQIAQAATPFLQRWGGVARLKSCYSEI